MSLTRHVADLRCGITTIAEKWESLLGTPVKKISGTPPKGSLDIPANYIPDEKFLQEIIQCLKDGELPGEKYMLTVIEYPWQLFEKNDLVLRQDFNQITSGRTSAALPPEVNVLEKENIFIETGAKLYPCYINAQEGPVYIAEGALVMEGCMLRGPLALLPGSTIKMGTRIYGATTIGPGSVAGGEIKNSIFTGYSNKGHDGYLGDSVLGEYCNLGAGTSNSNLKNNASPITYQVKDELYPAGKKGGLIMGDFSRTAINTSLNTGTVIGVSCNVFGSSCLLYTSPSPRD